MRFVFLIAVFIGGSSTLEKERSNSSLCNLTDFIKSKDPLESQALVDDHANFCNPSKSVADQRWICRFLAIELDVLCSLPESSRPSTKKYTIVFTPKRICSMQQISATNIWIKKKLSSEERTQLTADLCEQLTATNETLRLVKLFYRMGQRLSDLENQTAAVKANAIEQRGSMFDLNKGDIDVAAMRNQSALEKKNTAQKNNSQGIPLGRNGEEPAVEQVNERQKPKPLDVYEGKYKEDRNWVEGKGAERSVNRVVAEDNRILPPIKLVTFPIVTGSVPRKRHTLRAKITRYDVDADEFSDNFITHILVFTLCMIVCYLLAHNKSKVLGLLFEGIRRTRSTHTRRLGVPPVSPRHVRLSQSS